MFLKGAKNLKVPRIKKTFYFVFYEFWYIKYVLYSNKWGFIDIFESTLSHVYGFGG